MLPVAVDLGRPTKPNAHSHAPADRFSPSSRRREPPAAHGAHRRVVERLVVLALGMGVAHRAVGLDGDVQIDSRLLAALHPIGGIDRLDRLQELGRRQVGRSRGRFRRSRGRFDLLLSGQR